MLHKPGSKFNNVLLSVKPEYVEKILCGDKIIEFRKQVWKNKVSQVFVYSTSPVRKIVASFVPGKIVKDTPKNLWDKYEKESGINKDDFKHYFSNSSFGYAIEINNVKQFIKPMDPRTFKTNFKAPVNFCYFLNEGILLRKNQYKNIILEIDCEKIKDGYRIKIQSPMDVFSRCPVIKEKGIPFSEHPLLRPYDKFLINGSPDVGKVFNVFIIFNGIVLPALICSIVVTKKRILVLPAWGSGEVNHSNKNGLIKESPIAHVTIDENANGEYKIHYTGATSTNKGKKKKIFTEKKLKLKNDLGVYVGTLGINGVEFLDPLGIIYRDIKEDDLPRKTIDEVNSILQSSLSGLNHLIKLPPEFQWDKEHHLEVSFAMAKKGLENGGYLLDTIMSQDPIAVEQLNMIELESGRNLLITFRMGIGKLDHSFVWKTKK